jgi:AcrR family transcriptional regulator
MARRYELRKRATSQAETRRRIVEATVSLHREVGPLRATVSAIAERAGVQRVTVYRHFADQVALIEACAGHWMAQHPLPDAAAWATVEDPEQRLRSALAEIYTYFGETEDMTAHLVRDIPDFSPELQPIAAPLLHYWELVRTVLGEGWRTRGRSRTLLNAALGHAIAFDTWRSLTREQGLDDTTAVDLMVRLARAANS